MIIPFGNDHHDQIGITHHHHWNPHQKTTLGADEFSIKITALKKELKELRSQKSAEINSSLEQVSSNALKSDFTLSLKQSIGPGANRSTRLMVRRSLSSSSSNFSTTFARSIR